MSRTARSIFGFWVSAYGGRLAAAARVAPVAAGNMVRYPRRELVEWYRNGPFGLEQGFTIGSRPRGRNGAAHGRAVAWRVVGSEAVERRCGVPVSRQALRCFATAG